MNPRRKILQIGAGSMGTRRLRDLAGRPDLELRLLDLREDRRTAARSRFGIETFADTAAARNWHPEALIISTPPGTKGEWVAWAQAQRLPHFVEADIWSYGAADRADADPATVAAPSLCFAFLPVIQALAARVREQLGTLLSYQFVLAGNMADWHPQEGNEYYGRHRNTAPAREMVPFELAWLAELFGAPRAVSGDYRRGRLDPSSFEDTWNLQFQLPAGAVGQVTVTMGCAADVRRGTAVGTEGAIHWDVNRGDIITQKAGSVASLVENFGPIGQQIETAYAAEIRTYLDAALSRGRWPHGYAGYQHAIATLAAAEASARSRAWIAIDPRAEPSVVLPTLSPAHSA